MATRKFRRKCTTISNTLKISTDWDDIFLSAANPKIPVYIPGTAREKQRFQEIFQKQ